MTRLLALMTMAASLIAADVAGNWKVTAEGPNGAMERTFAFKVDGNKLTGETVSSMFGKSVIQDGNVDGDNLSFTLTLNFQGNEMKVNYKGKVTGDTIQLTAELPNGGRTIEWKGKRTQ